VPSLTLRELQRLFWDFVAGAPDAVVPPSPDPALARSVRPSAALEPVERLRIYAGMYWLRIRDALREDYPRVAAALGPEGFDMLVRGYLARHPSEHPSLRHLGRHLPRFLRERPPPGAAPFLADLARLEWARVEAFDAPDATPLTVADLRAIPAERWPELRFTLVPGLDIVRSEWPLHRIWETPGAEAAAARTAIRVWREDWKVYHASMDPAEEAALASVLRGEPFAMVCEALLGHSDEEAAAAGAGLLARWVEDGLVVGAGNLPD
jgi:hypothetical protein